MTTGSTPPDSADPVQAADGADPADEVPPARPWFDTSDLREGAFFNDRLLSLLPLVGVWRGIGVRRLLPDLEPEPIGQQIVFAHNGGEFLSYTEYRWAIRDDGSWWRDLGRESGFWSLGEETVVEAFVGPVEELRVSISSADTSAETFEGFSGDQQWLFASSESIAVDGTYLPTGEQRLYRVTEDELRVSVQALQPGGGYIGWHDARLTRVL